MQNSLFKTVITNYKKQALTAFLKISLLLIYPYPNPNDRIYW